MPPQPTRNHQHLGWCCHWLSSNDQGQNRHTVCLQNAVLWDRKQLFQQGFIPVCTGKHQHRGQSAPGCCFGGRAAAEHLSLLCKWVQDWQGAARAWQRDNFVKVWKHSSLPPQHLAEAGTDIAGTWRNFHVQQPETGSTYPHHYRTNVSLQDKWQLITSYF